ncbi:MAG: N-6 DNA methylase [Candidatus Coatesbacteria bacterium]|nr:N-6 DNA methylase [Candidatus Coatesbacteria bacterium]
MAERTHQQFLAAAESYVTELGKLLKQPDRSGELSYRPALHRFLEAAAPLMGSRVEITFLTEPRRKEFGVPDFKVIKGHSQVGYIETKAIGADLNEVMRTDLLQRYKQLPTLILTDYLEFRVIEEGRATQTASLCSLSQIRSDLPLDHIAVEDVYRLMERFLGKVLPGVGTAEELAEETAWRTHLMRDAMFSCLKDGSRLSGQLQRKLDAFRHVLIHDLSSEQFADIYAQTVAYGLFAARLQSVQPGRLDTLTEGFSLKSAERLVPKANPLLRGLFKELADEDSLDPRWRWHASDIADLLGASNMRAIAEDMATKVGREDPIVHFYETFLKKYNPKIRETRGVYYTPEPVVSYIVRSVDHLLKEKFGKPEGLADKRVMVLDPAVGTGTFLTGVIKHLYKVVTEKGQMGTWPDFVRNNLLPRLFGFEVLMAPYVIAHLKVGMLLEQLDYTVKEDERLHIYLTNTLEQAAEVSEQLAFGFAKTLADEAQAANQVKAENPIMVIIGNPPYSGHSINPSRVLVNGKWKKTWIGELIEDYRKVDGKPLGERNPKWLQDDYVKFLRFAQWRIAQTGYGIVSMITNHSYLDNPTFRGMRLNLTQAFDEIYVLDLHGNVKKKEVAPDGSEDGNVFEIQQGVAISILVDLPKGMMTSRAVSHGHIWGDQQEKYDWLNGHQVAGTDWTDLKPETPSYWFVPRDSTLQAEYEAGSKITDVMPVNSVGIVTARDSLTTQFSSSEIWDVLREFARLQPEEARRRFRLGPDAQDWTVGSAQRDVNDGGPHRELVLPMLYRPYDTRYTYYTGRSRGFICRPRAEVMGHMLAGPNIGLTIGRAGQVVHQREWDIVFCAGCLADLNLYRRGGNCLFPLYLCLKPEVDQGFEVDRPYDPAGRRSNLSQKFIEHFSGRLNMDFLPNGRGDLEGTFGPEDIFAYIYGVFHSPTYRNRYAEFLKIDFPRVPLTSNAGLFRALCAKGQELVGLHLMRDDRLNNPSFWGTSYPVAGAHDVTCVDYRGPGDSAPCEDQPLETGRVYVNMARPRKATHAEYFDGVGPDVWEFRIGGYQVLDHWLKERKRHKRALTEDDIYHFQKVVAVLRETIRLMQEIDEVIEAHGGWPDAFQKG